nr:hypothetical protein [Tanacetum cinerariifolium]
MQELSDLTPEEKTRQSCGLKATNIILLGLPSDIYTIVNHHKIFRDIWNRVKELMEGNELTKQERESKLYDEFNRFTSKKGELIQSYYLRYTKLINATKQAKNLYEVSFDKLYAYLKQNENDANEVRTMRQRFSDPLALIANTYNSPPSYSRVGVINIVGDLKANPPKVIKCYNYKSEGHIAKQCTTKKRVKDEKWFKEKMLLAQAQETKLNTTSIFKIDHVDAFDLDCDEAPMASAIFMARLSPAGYVNGDDNVRLVELCTLRTIVVLMGVSGTGSFVILIKYPTCLNDPLKIVLSVETRLMVIIVKDVLFSERNLSAHYGYNCPPKLLIIPDLEPFNNQTVDELPQTVPSFDPTRYSEDGNSFTYDSTSNLVYDSPNVFNPPSQLPLYSCKFCRNDARYGHYCTPQIDSLFDEFTGELTLLKSIPPGINETDCDPENEIRLIKRLLYDNSSPRPPKEFISENSDNAFESFSLSPIPVEDSDYLMEEIDLSFTLDDPMPPGIEEDDYDSERDILIFEELLSNDSLSLPENESFHFVIPSSSRPPAKPPDGNSGILNVKVMGDISEQKVSMPRLMSTRVPNQEKSPELLPHLGHEAFQPSAECPMMIYGKNTHILDIPLFHFYPP